MKNILLVILLLTSSVSFAEKKPVETEVSFQYAYIDNSITFRNRDYFYHLSNFNFSSDNKNYLLVIEVPHSSGQYRLSEKNVYIADFSKCSEKENGVSLFRGNDMAFSECDSRPIQITPIKINGNLKFKSNGKFNGSYQIQLNEAVFEVEKNILRFQHLNAEVHNINYYGP